MTNKNKWKRCYELLFEARKYRNMEYILSFPLVTSSHLFPCLNQWWVQVRTDMTVYPLPAQP